MLLGVLFFATLMGGEGQLTNQVSHLDCLGGNNTSSTPKPLGQGNAVNSQPSAIVQPAQPTSSKPQLSPKDVLSAGIKGGNPTLPSSPFDEALGKVCDSSAFNELTKNR